MLKQLWLKVLLALTIWAALLAVMVFLDMI